MKEQATANNKKHFVSVRGIGFFSLGINIIAYFTENLRKVQLIFDKGGARIDEFGFT
jgi:hypothetical protein